MSPTPDQTSSPATARWKDLASQDDVLAADVIVVGGGLAGLTAAAYAVRGGARVLLLERASEPGGRASTHDDGGFLFNVGPHALYAGAAAARSLAELGVRYTGRRPSASGGLALHRDALHALPGGFVSLLTTDLLTLGGKLELGRALGSLGKIDPSTLRGRTLAEWLETGFQDGVVRGLVEALMRLTAYANDPSRSCAAAALEQLQHGLGAGVLYLDGGWATLVAGLRRAAERAGVRIETGRRVCAVRATATGVEVELAPPRSAPGTRDVVADTRDREEEFFTPAGEGAGQSCTLHARVAVLAVPPPVAAALVEGPGSAALSQWAATLRPVKAACLDLGLRRLPDPRRLFVIGVDRPLYFSVHSASARLAPEGAAVVHVAKYLGPEPDDPKAVERELEQFCDLVQPGWRSEVAERRYLPSMLVTGALVETGRPRPGPEVPGTDRLVVAGDWVGREGMIADAAVASGREAGRLAASRCAAPGRDDGGRAGMGAIMERSAAGGARASAAFGA